MAMGGGGGGGAASPSPEERYYWYSQANPNWSKGESYDAAMSNMMPMQYENWRIGQQMVRGTRQDPGAIQDLKRYGMQMSNLAQGGLMVRGMGAGGQFQQAMNAPNLAPGIQARMAGRMGVTATPEQQAAMNQQQALTQASTRVGLANQTRLGLANAQRDMRFGGLDK